MNCYNGRTWLEIIFTRFSLLFYVTYFFLLLLCCLFCCFLVFWFLLPSGFQDILRSFLVRFNIVWKNFSGINFVILKLHFFQNCFWAIAVSKTIYSVVALIFDLAVRSNVVYICSVSFVHSFMWYNEKQQKKLIYEKCLISNILEKPIRFYDLRNNSCSWKYVFLVSEIYHKCARQPTAKIENCS